MFSLVEKIFIPLFSSKVGEDDLGNSYYVSKFTKNYLGKNKRFVVYKLQQEPTKVSASWHSWLHYMSDEIPVKKTNHGSISVINRENRRIRLPNFTGTKLSYLPKIMKLNTKQIEIWRPE